MDQACRFRKLFSSTSSASVSFLHCTALACRLSSPGNERVGVAHEMTFGKGRQFRGQISMWGMSPWGGYGANPLPGHLQQPEGIYEDLNKVISSQFYWDPKRTAEETVREYAASEFSPDVADDVLRAVRILEANHRRKKGGFERSPQQTAEARELLVRAEGKLTPQARRGWRWRILYLRALIDDELNKSGGKPRGSALKEAFAELVRIYHAEHVHTNRVAPPELLP